MQLEQLARSGLESIHEIVQSGRGGTCVYLVRDRETLARRREMYYRLAQQQGHRTADVPIQMWGGWVNRLTRRLDLSARRLGWFEQLIGIRMCLHARPPGDDSGLADVWDAGGMARSVAGFINEARQHGFSARQVKRQMPPEIFAVMKEWETLLEAKDWTDLLRHFELLRSETQRQGVHLRRMVVEDCSHMRPPEMRLLAAVARQCGSVDIYLPHDPDRPDLYPASEELASKLGPLAQHVTTYRPATDPGSLSWRVFRAVPPAQQVGKQEAAPTVCIWTVADERQQASRVAACLKEQLASRRRRPGDCCVVVRDDKHRRRIARQLQRAGVPYVDPARTPLGDTRLGETVKAVVEVISEPTAENIIRLAGSPYFCPPWHPDDSDVDLTQLSRMVPQNCTGEEILQRLDEVVDSLNYRIKGGGSLSWGSTDSLREQLLMVKTVKNQVSQLMDVVLISAEGGQLNWSDMLGHLHSCISRLGIPRRLEQLVREDGGYSSSLLEDAAAQKAVHKHLLWTLDELGRAVWSPGEQTVSWEILRRAVGDLLSELIFEPPRSIQALAGSPLQGRGVHLASASQAASGSYDLVLIPYMVEGTFPRSRPENWLENRLLEQPSEAAQDWGDWGDPRAEDRREADLFFRLVDAVAQQLILLRPLQLSGDPQAASPYLGEIEAVWPVDRTDYTLAAGKDEIHSITCPSDLRRSLVRTFGFSVGQHGGAKLLQNSFCGPHLEGIDPQVAPSKGNIPGGTVEDMLRCLRAEEQRWGPHYGKWDGVLEGEGAAAHLREIFDGEPVLSITAFNRYAGCPFRSFCEQLLQLESPFSVPEDISALFVGQIYHQVLEEYYRKRSQQVALKEYSPSERPRALRRLFDKYCGQFHRGSSWLSESTVASLSRRGQETLDSLLEAEFERMSASSGQMHLFPDQFELRFRESAEQLGTAAHPVYPDGAPVVLRGKIDRVDRTDAPGSDAPDSAVVFDYKLSSEPPGLQEVRDGDDLQMPLYLLAARRQLENLKVEGGAYISMSKASWHKGVYTQQGARLLGLDESRKQVEPLCDGEFESVLREALDHLSRYFGAMRQGQFPVAPSDHASCRRCPYAGVCRGQQERLKCKSDVPSAGGGGGKDDR